MAILFAPIRNVNPMIARSPGYFFCWAEFSPDQKVGFRRHILLCLFSINALIRVAGHWSRKTTVIVRVIVREERHSTRHVRPNVKNDGVSVLAQLPHADTDTHGRNAERLSFERIRYALNA